MKGVFYLNRSGRNRVSGHADENDRDRWGKRHHAARSDMPLVSKGMLRVVLQRKIVIGRLVSSVTRGSSRREKRVECPESRASMKYIEGCILLLFRKGRKRRADANTP